MRDALNPDDPITGTSVPVLVIADSGGAAEAWWPRRKAHDFAGSNRFGKYAFPDGWNVQGAYWATKTRRPDFVNGVNEAVRIREALGDGGDGLRLELAALAPDALATVRVLDDAMVRSRTSAQPSRALG